MTETLLFFAIVGIIAAVVVLCRKPRSRRVICLAIATVTWGLLATHSLRHARGREAPQPVASSGVRIWIPDATSVPTRADRFLYTVAVFEKLEYGPGQLLGLDQSLFEPGTEPEQLNVGWTLDGTTPDTLRLTPKLQLGEHPELALVDISYVFQGRRLYALNDRTLGFAVRHDGRTDVRQFAAATVPARLKRSPVSLLPHRVRRGFVAYLGVQRVPPEGTLTTVAHDEFDARTGLRDAAERRFRMESPSHSPRDWERTVPAVAFVRQGGAATLLLLAGALALALAFPRPTAGFVIAMPLAVLVFAITERTAIEHSSAILEDNSRSATDEGAALAQLDATFFYRETAKRIVEETGGPPGLPEEVGGRGILGKSPTE